MTESKQAAVARCYDAIYEGYQTMDGRIASRVLTWLGGAYDAGYASAVEANAGRPIPPAEAQSPLRAVHERTLRRETPEEAEARGYRRGCEETAQKIGTVPNDRRELSDVADALARQVEAQASTDPFGVRLRRALRDAVEYGYESRRLEEPRDDASLAQGEDQRRAAPDEAVDAIARYLTALADALEPTQTDPRTPALQPQALYQGLERIDVWESDALRRVARSIAKRAAGLRALAGVTVPQP